MPFTGFLTGVKLGCSRRINGIKRVFDGHTCRELLHSIHPIHVRRTKCDSRMKMRQPKIPQRLTKKGGTPVEQSGANVQCGLSKQSLAQANHKLQSARFCSWSEIGLWLAETLGTPNSSFERTGNERGRIRGTRERVCLAAENERQPAAQLNR